MPLRALMALVLALAGNPAPAQDLALPDAMRMAIASEAVGDPAIAAHYRSTGFAPLWFGASATARREALVEALQAARVHGLPAVRYDAEGLRSAFAATATSAGAGAVEVETTRLLLRLARDAASGVVEPRAVDPGIRVEPPRPDASALLAAVAGADPRGALRAIWPRDPGYAALLREKLRLEALRDGGGWGAGTGGVALEPGDSGADVARLRDRLVRMGYLRPTASARYDAMLTGAVRMVQADHGLTPDGVAGAATLAAIDAPIEARLAQVLINLERRRWLNRPLEPRHVLVNLAAQHATVVDHGVPTFETVVVVGADAPGRRTPEFAETMTHMVVNPSWYVPRSIAVGEYLPTLRRGGARHLELHSSKGRVDPAKVDFSRYDERTFPYSLRQPPGPSNALGRVKFMFPNDMNIYLHDTPSRDLFAREQRTFSHGCVRVARPLELAAHLLAPQTATPREDVDAILATGRERRVDLETPVGVHLVYWTAWIGPDGRARYRTDPYGRDAALREALVAAGVELGPSPS